MLMSNQEKRYPKVGVAVIVVRDGKVLIGKRKEAYGQGTWALPGGGLRFGETLEECARREAKEEAGIEVGNVSFATVVNDVMSDLGKHYVTIYMKAEYLSGESHPADGEFEIWEWRGWDDLPSPRFIPLENFLKSGYKLH